MFLKIHFNIILLSSLKVFLFIQLICSTSATRYVQSNDDLGSGTLPSIRKVLGSRLGYTEDFRAFLRIPRKLRMVCEWSGCTRRPLQRDHFLIYCVPIYFIPPAVQCF
jgi:hypothetical protein